MGESVMLQQSLNHDHQNVQKSSGGISFGKQRQMSVAELMAMPPDTQLIWAKGVGYFLAKKLRQNEIAPFCYDLAPDPLEGGVLPPDPKITLTIPKGDV